MSRPKDPVARDADDAASRPSRTLKILAQLRGEDPRDLMAGLDAEQDPELLPPDLEPLDAPPDAADPASLSFTEQGRVARFRSRAGAYRGSSPSTRSR